MAAQGLPVERACAVLGVSVSGYYGWLPRPPSERSIRHAWLSEAVGEIHAGSRQAYGTKRVHAELVLGRGVAVCRQTVETLMRRAGLRGISGRPKWRSTANIPTAADLVDRDFARDEPNQLWAQTSPSTPPTKARACCAVVPGRLQAPGRGRARSTRGPPRRWPPTRWAWRSTIAAQSPVRL